MIVHDKDIDNMGIREIETDKIGQITFLKGILPRKISIIGDKRLYWAEQGIGYSGG